MRTCLCYLYDILNAGPFAMFSHSLVLPLQSKCEYLFHCCLIQAALCRNPPRRVQLCTVTALFFNKLALWDSGVVSNLLLRFVHVLTHKSLQLPDFDV